MNSDADACSRSLLLARRALARAGGRAHRALRQRRRRAAQRRSAGHRDDPGPGRGPRDQARHPARFPDHLSPHRRLARRGRLRRAVGDARRQRGEVRAPRRMANGVRVRIGSAEPAAQRRRARIRHPLSHHAADRLLRRTSTSSTGTPPAPAGPSRSTWPRRASTCRRRSRSSRARSTPARRARAARTPRRRAAARPHRVPHHAAAAGRQRADRRGRLAQGRGDAADVGAAARSRCCRTIRRCCGGARRRSSSFCIICSRGSMVGRDPAPRHRHSAVRARRTACRPRRCASSRK